MEKTLPEAEQKQKKIKQRLDFILQECRMVLPGIQALFGFQLIVVFNDRFFSIPSGDRLVHLAAILFIVASVGLLMGPAAYHRLASPDELPPELCKIGTRLVCLGMATLMISISLEIYLVTKLILDNPLAGIISGATTFIFLSIIWYVFPLINRRGEHHQHSIERSTPVLM
jgi:hypothetical protein